jgi:hypothetical protein
MLAPASGGKRSKMRVCRPAKFDEPASRRVHMIVSWADREETERWKVDAPFIFR